MMTDQEIEKVANLVATRVMEELQEKEDSFLLLHFTEHGLLGSALIINEARAKANPCNCFTYEGKDYCFAKGAIGLLTGGQEEQYCTAGKRYEVAPGIKERFEKFSEATKEAHKRIEAVPKGERFEPWLQAMTHELAKRHISV